MKFLPTIFGLMLVGLPFWAGYMIGVQDTTAFCNLAAKNIKSGAWIEAPQSHDSQGHDIYKGEK